MMEQHKRRIGWPRRSRLAYAIATAILASSAAAQDVADELAANASAEDDSVEVIMVTGTRASLASALDAKRESRSIMDGIASDGIGRMPDLNLAEALSRVTGVQLDYSGTGGERREGQIAIRGLPNTFAKTQINGQTLATPNFNGGFSYGTFEADVVSAVNVIKSPMASYDDGGLSGIVDIRLLRPLEVQEDILTIETSVSYEESAEAFVPSVGVTMAKKFLDDSFGVFLSSKWAKQDFRTDSARINGYDGLDEDGDGFSDLYTPNEARFNSRTNEGDRLSVSGGLEWQARDDLNFGLIGIYSKYDLVNNLDQLRIQDAQSIEGFNRVDGGINGDTNTQALFIDAEVDAESRYFDDEYYTYGITADVTWNITEDWIVKGVLHTSDAGYDRFTMGSIRNQRDRDGNGLNFYVDTGAGDFDEFQIDAVNLVEGEIVSDNNAAWLTQEFYSYGASPTEDNNPVGEWRQRFLSSTGIDRKDKEKSAQVDFTHYYDSSIITSVDFGIKYRKHDRHQERPSWSVTDFGWDFSGIEDTSLMGDNRGRSGQGFFGGNIDSGVVGYLVPDVQATYQQLLATNECVETCIRGLPYKINNNETFDTSTDVYSAYVMVDFDFEEHFNIPVRGNIGVRQVNTRRTTTAYTASDLLDNGEQLSAATIDFSHALPSLNLMWDVTEELTLRSALYKSMTRPSAGQFRVDSSVNVEWQDQANTIPEELSVTLGNPELLPFEADAFDLSLEWYHRKGSGISLAYFYKNVKNGIENRDLCPSNIQDIEQLSNYDFTGVITGNLSIVNGICVDQAGVQVAIQDSINNDDEYDFSGWEVSVVHNFDELPAPWNGFGIQANLTLVDTDEGSSLDDSGNRLPLVNVSDRTSNFALFYDAAKWGVRLTHRARSEYWLEAPAGDTFSGEDRFVGDSQRLDFSASWRFHKDFRLKAEIFNLTEEVRTEYQAVEERVRDLRWAGRTYGLSLRYRF